MGCRSKRSSEDAMKVGNAFITTDDCSAGKSVVIRNGANIAARAIDYCGFRAG
jgi:hypothetical protein